MYRLNKENEITNMQRKDKKYETENKRLRAELVVLQRTCNTMRQERDAAFEEKQQALARAAAFEQDRDKVQRVFKVTGYTLSTETTLPFCYLPPFSNGSTLKGRVDIQSTLIISTLVILNNHLSQRENLILAVT